jgi:plastocyanin
MPPTQAPPSPTQAPAPTATRAPPVVSGPPNSITIHATNFTFSPNAITVSSGSSVTIHFVNDDQAVPHNIAFDVGGLQFTDVCSGPCTADLTFTAPAPGQYSFACTVHPYMTGTLTVN